MRVATTGPVPSRRALIKGPCSDSNSASAGLVGGLSEGPSPSEVGSSHNHVFHSCASGRGGRSSGADNRRVALIVVSWVTGPEIVICVGGLLLLYRQLYQ
uniref:Uncharacterized protein n=1 Tax=Solanum tuberosum TaxID=4113 RepID=M1BFH3_SOLTU